MRDSKSEIPFPDRVARVWGGLNEIVRTEEDADVAVADFFQVTPQELRSWRLAEGRHRCPGVTTRGHGCRNYASALIDYDPRVWLARAPEFCPIHLKSRQEQAAARSGPLVAALQIASRNAAAEDDAGVTAR